jgi:hypothetical protein
LTNAKTEALADYTTAAISDVVKEENVVQASNAKQLMGDYFV